VIVGAGTRFLSGISYYTHRLALSLASQQHVSVLLMRRMMPAILYPGRARVGKQLVNFDYPADVEVFDGLDWNWGTSAVRTARFLGRSRPDAVVLQWWTGTVLHSFVMIAILARRRGAVVILEVHEAQDVGEMNVPLAGQYVRKLFPVLVRMCAAVVVHSEFDRALVDEHFGLQGKPVVVIPHGPYTLPVGERTTLSEAGLPGVADDEYRVCRLLYFGIIRPFKGVEDLLDAFAMLPADEAAGYTLTVVGETWEGWTRPAELIATHPHRDRITFINRYVNDDEVTQLFADADGVVLPYHRSSSSGPLLVAIGNGLPVIVTSVGGLVEAAGSYEGAIFVPPRDPAAIRCALPELAARAGERYETTTTWDVTSERYAELLERLLSPAASPEQADSPS